jgi:hypothetical protein
MVLLLHGFLLAVDTFEGSFYTFSMSQLCGDDREAFSLLMKFIAQFQSAVVVCTKSGTISTFPRMNVQKMMCGIALHCLVGRHARLPIIWYCCTLTPL